MFEFILRLQTVISADQDIYAFTFKQLADTSPKRLTLHQFLLSLGIEPVTLALQVPYSTICTKEQPVVSLLINLILKETDEEGIKEIPFEIFLFLWVTLCPWINKKS